MAESDDDEIGLLYDDVLTRLERQESLTDMDLDTLVEVYDYAYDLSDEFVTAEIMGNVLGRDSDFQPMLERKAFRYALLSEIQGAKIVARSLPDSSFVKKLIMVQTEWDQENWEDSYKKLFADVRSQSLDEYDAMCLIDFALAVDDVAHLNVLLSLILPYCRYPEDFLVDLSGTLLDNDLPAEAVPVLLELTTLQPFSLDYWLQLAELYVNRLNNYEEGYSAIDYALAIDPESGRAMMLKGDLLMKVDGYAEAVHRIADRLMDMPEFKDNALYLKAGAYIKEGKHEDALIYLGRYLEVCNNPLDIFVLILSINDGNVPESMKNQLTEFVRKADVSEVANWLSRARRVMDEKAFETLLDAVIEADVSVSDDVRSLVILQMYKNGEYARVKNFFERDGQLAANPFDSLVYIMSRLRLGETDNLRELLSRTGDEIYEAVRNSGPEKKLLHVGAAKLVYDLNRYFDKRIVGKPDLKSIDHIDPFLI